MKNFTLTCLSFVLALGLNAQTQIDLPISWDDATVNYNTTAFEGGQSAADVDPTDPANNVLKFTKPVGAQPWAGVTLGDNATGQALATVIPFDASNNLISVEVYSPAAGLPMRLKAEVSGNPTQSVETDATTTVANAWETLVFDFSNQSAGTAAINYAFQYNMLSFFGDFLTAASGQEFYVDDVYFGGTPPPPPAQYNVTFKVDMRGYAGNYTTPEVNGEFNGWCGNCNALADPENDSIWETTVIISADSIEYKFSHDAWAGQEELTPGSACTKTTGAFTNRFLILTGDTVLPAVCWESCSECIITTPPPAPDTNSVTFQVDMRGYTGSYTTPEVNGVFNGWCGNCNPMTDANNDSIWETTIDIALDTIEFKFSHDAWTGQEELDSASTCVLTTIDGNNVFVNRLVVVSSDTVLPVVCWNSCEACPADTATGIFNVANLDLNIYPNPSNGIINIETASFQSYSITMMDALGKTVYTSSNVYNTLETVDVSSFENGIYMVILRADDNIHTSKVMVSK